MNVVKGIAILDSCSKVKHLSSVRLMPTANLRIVWKAAGSIPLRITSESLLSWWWVSTKARAKYMLWHAKAIRCAANTYGAKKKNNKALKSHFVRISSPAVNHSSGLLTLMRIILHSLSHTQTLKRQTKKIPTSNNPCSYPSNHIHDHGKLKTVTDLHEIYSLRSSFRSHMLRESQNH